MNYFKSKRVVVPFDFSDLSENAIEQAIELTEDAEKVFLIHVVPPSSTVVSFDLGVPVPPYYDDQIRDSSLKNLNEKFGSLGLAEMKCVIGDPGHEITEYAKTINADLIMMPSHGWTGLTRVLLGSVAERVLRLASCPVLILRTKADGK